MELRPAGYVMKRGTNPLDAIPYKRGRNHATGQVPCLHNTYTVQKRFTAIKHRCCVQSLTSVLTHGQLHPISVSVEHLVSIPTGSCRIYGRLTVYGTGFSPSTSVLFCQHHYTNAPYSFIHSFIRPSTHPSTNDDIRLIVATDSIVKLRT
jgi:hypothetical protein